MAGFRQTRAANSNSDSNVSLGSTLVPPESIPASQLGKHTYFAGNHGTPRLSFDTSCKLCPLFLLMCDFSTYVHWHFLEHAEQEKSHVLCAKTAARRCAQIRENFCMCGECGSVFCCECKPSMRNPKNKNATSTRRAAAETAQTLQARKKREAIKVERPEDQSGVMWPGQCCFEPDYCCGFLARGHAWK